MDAQLDSVWKNPSDKMQKLRITMQAVIFMLALIVTDITHMARAIATTNASEQALIAAFLYNFLKFTEWPPEIITREIKLCIPENQKFKELDDITGRSIENKPVLIKYINFGETIDDCQLLYLSREESAEKTRNWLKITRQKPILIVSNISEFLDMGGMIILINNGKTLNFEINLEHVRNSGLKLSAQLLQIARHIRDR